MNYIFQIENGKVRETLVNSNGEKCSKKEIINYVHDTSLHDRVHERDKQFVDWARANNIPLKADNLPYWAREALYDEDISIFDIQNAEPLTLLKWILEYHGIIGFERVISETVLSIFNQVEN